MSVDRIPGGDVSPRGRYRAVPVEGGARVVDLETGWESTIPLPDELRPECVSVADDGVTLAALAPSRGGAKKLVYWRNGKASVLQDGFALYALDLSSDGERLAYASFDNVHVASKGAGQPLARLPHPVDELDYRPDGSLLARCHHDPWGVGSIPIYYHLREDGSQDVLGNVREAEKLGHPVLDPLRKEYAIVYPHASPEFRERLIDRFGYNTPSYRVFSADRQRMVFSLEARRAPLEDGSPGIYILGPSDDLQPVRFQGPSPTQLHEVNFGPGEQVALAVGSGRPKVAVVSTRDGQATVLPVPLAPDKRTLAWSESGRYLGFQGLDGERPTVYCYDREKDLTLPVSPGELLGWEADKIRIRRPDGETWTLDPLPVDGSNAHRHLLGDPYEEGPAGTIRVGDDYVEVGPVRLPKRKP
ncbi:MAG: hypothetical protein HY319_22325 [Armatimonadetes bacterium]|nr:hypothetical protein [Armatimonadota bacterium]